MKIPKGLGGGGFGDMLAQAQQAMQRTQNLEKELALERVEGQALGIRTVFDGTGEIQSIEIKEKGLIDPEDSEGLEAALVAAIRDGYSKAVELRAAKMREIMPNVPGLDKLGF